jgi:hypothetical protein
MRKRRVLLALLAIAGLVAAGVWWWNNPLALPGRHRVDVYALNEGVSGPAGSTPALGKRCDADSYYVKQGGRPYCLTLNGDPRGGALAQVRVTESGGRVVIEPAEVNHLRDVADRLTERTSQGSRTLVLVVRGRPIALVPISTLFSDQTVRVEMFD